MTKDESVRNAFGQIAEDKNYEFKPNLPARNGAILDNTPFGATDASCIYVGSKGYPEIRNLHHTVLDTPENVPRDCVEIAFNLFAEYFRRTEGVALEDIS